MKFGYLLLLSLILVGISPPAFALITAGDSAPDFSAQTLDGEEVSLSDLKGKLLLMEMGATWCPSCNELAHQIDEIRPFLKENNVTLTSVYLADSAESINEHLKDENLKPADQTLIDSGDARSNYNVFSIPRIILIDENFKIVFDEMMLDKNELQTRIEKHLREP